MASSRRLGVVVECTGWLFFDNCQADVGHAPNYIPPPTITLSNVRGRIIVINLSPGKRFGHFGFTRYKFVHL